MHQPLPATFLAELMESRVEMKSTGYADSFRHEEHLLHEKNEDLQNVGTSI
jgi:hypothetical protein